MICETIPHLTAKNFKNSSIQLVTRARKLANLFDHSVIVIFFLGHFRVYFQCKTDICFEFQHVKILLRARVTG